MFDSASSLVVYQAAVLLEQERQQEMAKMGGPRSMPTVSPMRGIDPRAPLPPGVSMLPTQKQRVPPPPGEDNREVSRRQLY